jgi:hypothetical protein
VSDPEKKLVTNRRSVVLIRKKVGLKSWIHSETWKLAACPGSNWNVENCFLTLGARDPLQLVFYPRGNGSDEATPIRKTQSRILNKGNSSRHRTQMYKSKNQQPKTRLRDQTKFWRWQWVLARFSTAWRTDVKGDTCVCFRNLGTSHSVLSASTMSVNCFVIQHALKNCHFMVTATLVKYPAKISLTWIQ